MKVVIAIDSFKGSISSPDAGAAIREGIHRVFPDAEVFVRPLADGGEGTVEALALGMHGRIRTVTVTGPLGTPVEAAYGILDDSKTAIIEMSAAAGITLVDEPNRNPLYTTTYGVGELIRDAIVNGCRNFIVGIGGSATNDGGIGMLQALGYEFFDKNGQPVPFGAGGLSLIEAIEDAHVMPELKDCHFKIACDVTNPLCGPQGCSAIFGPQKGATPDMILQMVLEETRLESCIKDADIVITGEGRLDGQTIMGQAPIGVATIAKKYNKTVLAFSGCTTPEAVLCNQHGIDAFFPILHTITTLEEAMTPETTRRNLTDTTEQVFRLIQAVQIH